MTRHWLQLAYQIEMLTTFRIGTGYGIAGVVDSRTVRTAAGAVYVPGSSLKDRVRYHLGFLAKELGYPHGDSACRGDNPCPICNLLGNTAHEATLSFSDLHLARESNLHSLLSNERQVQMVRPFFEVSHRTNVMISRSRGVAQERHLFTSEVGAAGLFFDGRIDGYLSNAGRQLTINTGNTGS
jgi:CRISPR/Cas system CSM-associated protein Csm3 (group 7 of RAMP superfamily)